MINRYEVPEEIRQSEIVIAAKILAGATIFSRFMEQKCPFTATQVQDIHNNAVCEVNNLELDFCGRETKEKEK